MARFLIFFLLNLWIIHFFCMIDIIFLSPYLFHSLSHHLSPSLSLPLNLSLLLSPLSLFSLYHTYPFLKHYKNWSEKKSCPKPKNILMLIFFFWSYKPHTKYTCANFLLKFVCGGAKYVKCTERQLFRHDAYKLRIPCPPPHGYSPVLWYYFMESLAGRRRLANT